MNRKFMVAIVGLLILAMIGVGIIWHSEKSAGITSFQACAAKYPVQLSYPEVCVTPKGQRFVNPAQPPSLKTGHGGPCDDQTYYQAHINECRLE